MVASRAVSCWAGPLLAREHVVSKIVGFLREADAGVAVKDLCRKHGFSEGSYYLWRSKFGGMSVSDAKRLKELELENGPRNRTWRTR
jgi:transposase-like protein